MVKRFLLGFVLPVLASTSIYAQSGKIAGTVRSASDGAPLPGVNVLIEGSTRGAVTDLEGYYSILGLRPGTYTLRISFVGYSTQIVEDVEVNTGLTSIQDVSLGVEAIGLEGVMVQAARPIIELDVSANVANLIAADFTDLPLASLNEAIELQAGIEPGLQIRGARNDQVAFMLDGMSLRTGRFQRPFTNVSLTSIEQVQVQTGGFSAEYSNVQSGTINVTTKEPSRTRYSFDGMFRFEPAQPKNFGGLPEDIGSYYARPRRDPEVAFEGTNSLDPYTRRQYHFFEGWNAVASDLQGKGFDITPEELLDLEAFGQRKSNVIDRPDYTADFTLTGPMLPGSPSGSRLGDPRFLVSYRGTQTMYVYPQARVGYTSETVQLKVSTNLNAGMKLSLFGIASSERGINRNCCSGIADLWTGNVPYYPWQSGGNGLTSIGLLQGDSSWDALSDARYNRVNYDHLMIGGEFIHTITPHSFYEIHLHRMQTKYRSQLPDFRDDSFEDEDGFFVSRLWAEDGIPFSEKALCMGGISDLNGDGKLVPYCVGGGPLGFSIQRQARLMWDGPTFGATVRDTTDISIFTGRFDLTSQINRYFQIKTGAEIIISDFDMHFGSVNLLVGPEGGNRVPFSRSLIQGGFYTQTKLEFGGMIANLGVRLDYIDPLTQWWVIDNPFDIALNGNQDELDEWLPKKQVEAQLYASPRLGVSFPITKRSKFYFNYGHFRQQLDNFQLFGVVQSRAGGIEGLGNPEHPMPKTVAYELGFDQSLFDQFLIRISGFYRDVRNQSRPVIYVGLGDRVQYTGFEPWSYEDVRGVEFSVARLRGQWIEGFVNYTFLQRKTGEFGYAEFYENQVRQRKYLRDQSDFQIYTPSATPFARMNVTLKTPPQLGPVWGNWRLNFLAEWRDGQQFYWNGQDLTEFPQEVTIAGLDRNVSWRDYWMFDLRLSKHLATRYGDMQVFLDVSNVFNLRHLYRTTGFTTVGNDLLFYMASLHLPGNVFDGFGKGGAPYINIPGSDQPGDYRRPGTDFQPINAVLNLESVQPDEWAWYWSKETGTYHRWTGEDWEDVPVKELQQVLNDKAYIDMPNLTYNTFFNPRRFSLGLRFRF